MHEALKNQVPRIGPGILLRQGYQGVDCECLAYRPGNMLAGLLYHGWIRTGLHRGGERGKRVRIALLLQRHSPQVIVRQPVLCTGWHEAERLLQREPAIGVIVCMIQRHAKPQLCFRHTC